MTDHDKLEEFLDPANNDLEKTEAATSRIACRLIYPLELEALLHDNGFRILRQYGGWNREALVHDSPTIITVCAQRHDGHLPTDHDAGNTG